MKYLKTTYDINVMYARYVNAKENKVFERACKHEGMGVQFDYTAPATPWPKAELNRNLLPYLTEYMPYSMVGCYLLL